MYTFVITYLMEKNQKTRKIKHLAVYYSLSLSKQMTECDVHTPAFQQLCYASWDLSSHGSGTITFHLAEKQLPTLSPGYIGSYSTNVSSPASHSGFEDCIGSPISCQI